MATDISTLSAVQHRSILEQNILRDPRFLHATSGHHTPRAIILSGQPGAGKGGMTRAAEAELGHDAVVVDPDELRAKHPGFRSLAQLHPYTWADHTHPDASQWAKELRAEAIAQRKDLIIDGTLPTTDVIRELKAQGYDVEVRAVAAHRFESELGVEQRFADGIDMNTHGRYVPEHTRKDAYEGLPRALDEVARETGVPIQIYDREGRLRYDSRTRPGTSISWSYLFSRLWRLDFSSLVLPFLSPGRALKIARNARLTQARLIDLQHAADAQRRWHRQLPDRLQRDTPHHAKLESTY